MLILHLIYYRLRYCDKPSDQRKLKGGKGSAYRWQPTINKIGAGTQGRSLSEESQRYAACCLALGLRLS